MTHRRTLAGIVMAAASIAFAAPAASFDDQPMNELRLGSSQHSLGATAGAGCIRDGDRHTCSGDARALPLGGTLFIRPGHELALDFDWPVEHVHIGPAREPEQPCANCFRSRPASLVDLQPVGGKPARRWRGTIPAGLERGFLRLAIYAQYDSSGNPAGNRSFEAGVWVLRSSRRFVRVPELTGSSYAAAIRELERRGLRWRRNLGPLEFDTGAPPAPGEKSQSSGRVVAQSKAAGARVKRGGTIRLTVR